MQIGDGHAAVPGGADASKVRCVRHVPGTDFGAPGDMLAVRHVPGTDFGAPGDMLAIVDADWGRARGGAWRGGC
jgi:hypothetical protein